MKRILLSTVAFPADLHIPLVQDLRALVLKEMRK